MKIPPSLDRREFLATLGALTAGWARPAFADPDRTSYLANKGTNSEGQWRLSGIEGEIPPALQGTLYRISPGQKNKFGKPLKHLFDGDAYLAGFQFAGGQVTLRTKFIETPEHLAEARAGKMLYDEFGTAAHFLPSHGRIQPNVNVIPWDGNLLALSEAGAPALVRSDDFSYRGSWNFHGALANDMTFTAHPKFDPLTGDAYAYGIRRGRNCALVVYRMERQSGELRQLTSVPLPGFMMIHDMILSKEHIVFVVPPIRLNILEELMGRHPIGRVLHFMRNEPTRIIVLRKDGTGDPLLIEQPASVVFHHGNAFERDGNLVFDTFWQGNPGLLDLFFRWSADSLPSFREPPLMGTLTRFTVDLKEGKILSRVELGSHQEFPAFDPRMSGEDARYLYALEFNNPADPLASSKLVKNDLHAHSQASIVARKGEVWGEPVFLPDPRGGAEDQGLLFIQGYSSDRDETFLEMREAQNLDFQARLWTGTRFPLGFHGCFVSD